MRRFDDMMKMYSAAEGSETGAPMAETTLILNSNSPLVRKLADNPDERVAKQIYTSDSAESAKTYRLRA